MWKGGGRREEGTSPHAPNLSLALWSPSGQIPSASRRRGALVGGDQAGWGQGERRAEAGLKQLPHTLSPFLTHWLPTFPSGQPGCCKSESTPYKNKSAPFPLEKTPETWAVLLAFPLGQCDHGRGQENDSCPAQGREVPKSLAPGPLRAIPWGPAPSARAPLTPPCLRRAVPDGEALAHGLCPSSAGPVTCPPGIPWPVHLR